MRGGVPDPGLVRVFIELREPLRAMLLTRLGDEEDAHDLIQETFLRVVELPDRAEIDDQRAYIWRIASNLAVDRLRATRRLSQLFTSDEEAAARAPDGHPTPEEEAQNRAYVREMKRVLQNLPPNCRQAFLLSRREGMDYNQIAGIMGVSANMVKKHLMRALGALRVGMPL